MVSRSTIVKLALALAALLAALHATSRREAPDERSAFLLPAAASGPVSLAVSRPGEPPIALKRAGEQWAFAPPGSGRVDQEAVEAVLSALSGIAAVDRVSPRQRRVRDLSLADFGLEEPRVAVALEFKGREPASVAFGADAPGGGVFAMASGSSDVAVVPGDVRDALPASCDALRSRSFVASGPEPPNAFEIRRPGESALKIEKDLGGRWRIVSPFDAPADGAVAESISALLLGPSVRRFVWMPGTNDTDAAAAAARLAHGLAPDEAAASLAVWRRSSPSPETFVFGAEDPSDPGAVFAASMRDGTVCTVDKAVADAVETPLERLRDRRVFPFDAGDATAFSVKAAGRDEVRLERGADGAWSFVLPAAAPTGPGRVAGFLDGLLSWRDGKASLANGGRDAVPADGESFSLEFSLAGREAPFAVSLAKVSPEESAPYWAVRAAGAGAPVTVLDPSADPVSALSPGALASLRDRTALALAPGSVSSAAPLGDAAADAQACAAVAALATNFVAAAVSSLSSSDSAAWGLLPPRAQWSVATALPDRPVAIIQLGSGLPDGTAYFRIKGDPAVFVASPRDAAVLSAFSNQPKPQNGEN